MMIRRTNSKKKPAARTGAATLTLHYWEDGVFHSEVVTTHGPRAGWFLEPDSVDERRKKSKPKGK